MTPKECALCGLPITDENDYKEHLIPNSIGGRKKVSGFICNACNSKTGKDWDADLARQLNSLSVFFGISRERGEVPSQTVETTKGEKLQLSADGSMGLTKPRYEETPHERGIKISIEARSIKEAKIMLAGAKRKYPKIDFEKTISSAQSQSYYPDDMVKFELTIGGHKAGRSIVKTCLALAVESGINPKSCKVARDYLTKPNGEACFGYYYERDLVVNRPEGVIFHCVSVSGNPNTKQLLGYVEYYSVWRIVVCLSDEYESTKFSRTYAINPISGDEIDMTVNLSSLSQEDIASSYRYEKIPDGSREKAFNKAISIGMKRSSQKEMNRVINESVQYAFKNCGAQEGEMLTGEHIVKIPRLLMEKLEPFIIHQLRRPKK